MKHIKTIIEQVKYFLDKCSDDNISAIAGQSAFFIILSFVPFLMFAFAILSFLNIPQVIFDSYIENNLSSDVGMYLEQIINSSYASAASVALVTIIAALWSSGKGVYSVTEGIRVIYNLPNKHNWLIKRIFSAGYTFLMFVVLILAIIVSLISNFFQDSIEPYIKTLPYAVTVLYGLRYLIMFVLVVLMIALALKVYLRSRVEDKRYAKFRVQLPGAILTAFIWTLLSKGINIYVELFNGFSIYGSIATAAVIMIWLYFTMYVFLCCVQFNYIYHEQIYNFKLRNLIRTKRIRIRKKK